MTDRIAENDPVCDPFFGSGTTVLACKKLGRRFVGCDVEQECMDTAICKLANPDGPSSVTL